MTENKPMMIDGVDVKECTCFSNWYTIITGTGIVYKEVENCCTPQQKPCKDVKNCCFKKLTKQLVLKTQECKQAEQKLEQIRQIVNKLSLSINWNINKNAYEKLQSIIQIIDEVE